MITPSLNGATFLPDLLKCIEHQTYPRIEHLVVDGGSDDGTHELLQEAAPEYHSFLVQRDGSMYEAINTGVRHSNGAVVACLNTDDLYFPDTVATAVDFLERHRDVGIAYGDQLTVFVETGSFDLHRMVGEKEDP